ncbi:restriction endonuclease subunit R [Nostoc sp. 'Peltigera malacea cyanobiont' DB3992]|uniref:restriction endonuclease subunit R n=1 Tax=Nostoc sp. 'Peltigera malacea cyanobiont' DB3992 TaxID=1206980 RepID=UPI000C040AB9|nr:restriction endonuclease subunit R [Nostoc sp. 'Peltigera malacea cyanobiont' DB3992]PHM11456.1 restriction endonuclease subunit R [Nostoc sp. 'Peltigera malacea cyanobiont' DB3992]
MTILNARNLSLEEIQRLFGFQEQYSDSFSNYLSLEPLIEAEQQELLQIRNDFRRYLTAGKVSEGQVKFLAVAPLLRLAGFYRYPIEIVLEENIADIEVEDEDIKIKGRFDILAISKAKHTKPQTYFWVLLIESKNSQIDISTGLPQLLTYAYKNLDNQKSVWGLATNGRSYQFVYIEQGNPPIYYLLPELNLMERERSSQLLQVLKAICQL